MRSKLVYFLFSYLHFLLGNALCKSNLSVVCRNVDRPRYEDWTWSAFVVTISDTLTRPKWQVHNVIYKFIILKLMDEILGTWYRIICPRQYLRIWMVKAISKLFAFGFGFKIETFGGSIGSFSILNCAVF